MLLGTASLCSGEKQSLLTCVWRAESDAWLSESITRQALSDVLRKQGPRAGERT